MIDHCNTVSTAYSLFLGQLNKSIDNNIFYMNMSIKSNLNSHTIGVLSVIR